MKCTCHASTSPPVMWRQICIFEANVCMQLCFCQSIKRGSHSPCWKNLQRVCGPVLGRERWASHLLIKVWTPDKSGWLCSTAPHWPPRVKKQRRYRSRFSDNKHVCFIQEPHLGDNVFKLAFFPGIRRMVHHGDDGIVIFLVFIIEEHQLCPEVGLLSCPENLKIHINNQYWVITKALAPSHTVSLVHPFKNTFLW